MAKRIILLDADQKESAELMDLLKGQNYKLTLKNTMAELDSLLTQSDNQVVMINSDTIPVTNRSLNDLKRKYPAVGILIMSRRPFHPELKEAIGSSVYACLTLPIEPDEINYLLKGIHDNEVDTIH